MFSRKPLKIKSRTPHIQVLEPNHEGKDVIITDVHGQHELLDQTLWLLDGHDRLFCCGDLIDRGPDSLKVIEKIQQERENGKNIYCVRGNHEDMALEILDDLLALSQTDQIPQQRASSKSDPSFLYTRFPSARNSTSFIDHLRGSLNRWKSLLSSLSYPFSPAELKAMTNFVLIEKRRLKKNIYPLITLIEQQRLIKFWNTALNFTYNGGAWLFYLTTNQHMTLGSFLTNLPYMINVDNEFNVVHAAPVSDKEIIEASKKGFTYQQIDYMTWARSQTCSPNGPYFVDKKRSTTSLLTYTGHNPKAGTDRFYRKRNIINLDPDTFSTEQLFVWTHNTGTLSILSTKNPAPETKRLDDQTISRFEEAFHAIWQQSKAAIIPRSRS